MSAWVYVRSEPNLWTVGFYDPAGKWQSDSDHDTAQGAASRLNYLNGGNGPLIAERDTLVLALRNLVYEFDQVYDGGYHASIAASLFDQARAALAKVQP